MSDLQKTKTIRWTELKADPARLLGEMTAGNTVFFTEAPGTSGTYTLVPTSLMRRMADYCDIDPDEAEDMVSLRKNKTGVDNTVFVSTKGYAQHAARIKIAIDPPDSLNAAGKSVTMAFHNFSTNGDLPPHVRDQARSFIERNRDVLTRYWNQEIDTQQMIAGLAPPE